MIETYHNDSVYPLTCRATKKQIENWIKKNQHKYEKELKVGTNIKDGFVAYYDR